MPNIVSSSQGQLGDTNNDEDVAPDETWSTGQVINMYQCSRAMQKTNTKKKPHNKNGRYNLRSQEAPPTVGEI